MNRLMIALQTLELLKDDEGATRNELFEVYEQLKKAKKLQDEKEINRIKFKCELLNRDLTNLENRIDNLQTEAYGYLCNLPENEIDAEGLLIFKIIAIDCEPFEDVAEWRRLPVETVLKIYNDTWVDLQNLRI